MPLADKTQPISRLASTQVPSSVFVSRIAAPAKKPTQPRSDIPGIKILGAGASAGSKLVLNEDLAALGYDSDWIVQRTGIKSRYHVAEGEATSDMAIRAGEQCLANAGVDASEVDLIIVATVSPDYLTPSTACIVQAHLGAPAAAFDLNAACSGFIYGLAMASQSVRTGCVRNALIIGAETLTMLSNPEDKKTYPLFGDGAGAVLISKDPEPNESKASGILAYRLASEGKLGDALKTPAGGSRKPFSQSVLDRGEHFLKMDGRAVFKWAVRLIPEIVDEMLTKASMSLSDIDLFIPHQANIRIIDAAVEGLGIDRKKVFVNLDRYGNTSAASIPISIAEAVEQGRIQPGSNVLMVGFGAGLTWGSCLFRW
jgi:3-oxoacyl-[acyl-carrier-protein] synthase-3